MRRMEDIREKTRWLTKVSEMKVQRVRRSRRTEVERRWSDEEEDSLLPLLLSLKIQSIFATYMAITTSLIWFTYRIFAGWSPSCEQLNNPEGWFQLWTYLVHVLSDDLLDRRGQILFQSRELSEFTSVEISALRQFSSSSYIIIHILL